MAIRRMWFAALLVLVSASPDARAETSGSVTIVSAKTQAELTVTVSDAPEEWDANLATAADMERSAAAVYLFPRDTVFAFTSDKASGPLDVLGVDGSGHVVWLYEGVSGDRFRASHLPVIAIIAARTGLIEKLEAKIGNLIIAKGFTLKSMDKSEGKPDGLDSAAAALKSSKDKHPKDVDAYLELATFLEGIDNQRGAREMVEKSLGIKPTATAHISLARMDQNTGETDAAIAHLEKAIAIDGASLNAHIYLGALLQKKESLDRALELFTTAIEKNPEVVEFRLSLARAQINIGKFDTAEKTLAPALAKESSRPDALRVLGDIHLRRGDMSAAATAYMEYLKTYPSAPHAADLRAFILVHRNATGKSEKKGEQP